ncbi:transforming growth factor beta receptor type 3 [Pholidichthys leucotaenia]
MMPSLSGVGWMFFFIILLWERPATQSVEVRCSVVGPVGSRHPVQGLLERFEAGPGCAARERGNKETHVIALGKTTNNPENKVTVLLKPLSLSFPPLRDLHLVLSSKRPISWWIEAERLPTNLSALVQISSHSTVQSSVLRLYVQTVEFLPFHPRVLHHWALKNHSSLSSLTHSTHGNRVYIHLGEDATLPAVCKLQSMFLSRNYITSDLQPQEVQGCTYGAAGGVSPEIHVIKLHSVGSGLCGSLQVEVIITLVPMMGNSKAQRIVLILSSSVPVNWAIVSHGVRGHIYVHSSNSVSPPYPPEPDLTLSSTLHSELSTISNLLLWASESGYTKVTSYTEADLANRFVIQLTEGGTDEAVVMKHVMGRPPWAKERKLRQWLNGGSRAGGGRESFTVNCDDGHLSVTVDQRILQTLSIPVAAVTLQNLTCQAQSNGSHFLLVFPVISCGTESLLLEEPSGVQYQNMLLLWTDELQTTLSLNETEKSESPLIIHFSCLAAVSSPPSPPAAVADNLSPPQTGLVPWVPNDPWPDPELSHLPTPRQKSESLLYLELFVTESYEQTWIGPCVITADHRVYVKISAKAPLADIVDVKSCVVSPLSDPKKTPFWTVISDGCSSDPSLTLSVMAKDEKEKAEINSEHEEEKEVSEGLGKGTIYRTREKRNLRKEDEMQPLQFSFILRPVYNNSLQFLHCSIYLCVSDSTRGEPMKETVKKDCQHGVQIPPLLSRSPKHQCEIRNLSRPMVVTQSISSLASKMQSSLGQRTKRVSVSTLTTPDPERDSSAVQTGVVIGVVFAAFIMGVSLMGGLWCIYNYTGARPAAFRECHSPDQTHEGHSIWSPPSLSDQSSSSV